MKLTIQIKCSLFGTKTEVLDILSVASEDCNVVSSAQNTAHISSYRSIWMKILIWI